MSHAITFTTFLSARMSNWGCVLLVPHPPLAAVRHPCRAAVW